MSISEWAWKAWAEFVPSYRDGRLDFGPIVIVTRKRLQRWAWESMELGLDIESRSPGIIREHAAQIKRDELAPHVTCMPSDNDIERPPQHEVSTAGASKRVKPWSRAFLPIVLQQVWERPASFTP